MIKNFIKILENFFSLDYTGKKDIWMTRQESLTLFVGILGVLLPILLWGFTYWDIKLICPLESISHYYYTRVGGIFVIIMSMLALLLLNFKGEKPIDFVISFIAGIFSLLLLLFPTDKISNVSSWCSNPSQLDANITIIAQNKPRECFHYVSAGIFLACLVIMSLYSFTRVKDGQVKANGDMKQNKKSRNIIYISMGIIMICAMAFIGIGPIILSEEIYNNYNLTFWMESIAVWAFGISWIIKSKIVLKD